MYFFLVCVIVVSLGSDSPTQWSSTVGPFLIVLLWTALKDMWEDIRRRHDDDAENFRHCWRYDFSVKEFAEVRWCDVLCGDLIWTAVDDAFPSDLLLLHSCGGQAFISTTNLDGETNLKDRHAADLCSALMQHAGPEDNCSEGEKARDLAAKMVRLAMDHRLEAELEEPRVHLTDMNGKLEVMDYVCRATSSFSLNFEHFVPRGCVLRNTPWTLGWAAYVGAETKTRLNVALSRGKMSNLQHYLNRCVVGLVLVLLLFCTYAGISARFWGQEKSGWLVFFIYWIVLYQILPISLYFWFEVFKLLLGFQINYDQQMVDRGGLGAYARTSDLVEELGQVDFVFSDKTGTLTENEMRFARCCIGGMDMGEFRDLPDAPATGIRKVQDIVNSSDDLRMEVRWFFFCLAVCHAAQVEKTEGDLHFSGSSPDEVAFLEAAHRIGISFTERRRRPGIGSEVVVTAPPTSGETCCKSEHVFTIRTEIPFSSDRKRMSVLCEYRGEIFCITKGADNVMGPLCEEPFSDEFVSYLKAYSNLGLRTLAIASKVVDREFLEDWQPRFVAAQSARDRDTQMAIVAAEMEVSLILTGVSAIEDRLQEGVPEAITMIKAAGIRFWVLTGDKTETAVEIARACKLFTSEMTLAYMTDVSNGDHLMDLMKSAEQRLHGCVDGGLVLDGTVVRYVVETPEAGQLFYQLATTSVACVCCRLSPTQKRSLIEIVRANNLLAITLAIGDGANDVSMIQGAQVGIGVRGKEGNQAVQASDVAISKFRFLVPLLLCHGRRAYRRVSVFLLFFIYKHVLLVAADMIWAHRSEFAGEIAYAEWLSAAFSLLFSSMQAIYVFAFDRDMPDDVACSSPELYVEGLTRSRFNTFVFVTWMVSAMWHGSLVWVVPNYWIGNDDTETDTFWISSVAAFTLVIVAVNFRIWLFSLNPFSWDVLLSLSLAFLVYILTLLILCYTFVGTTFQPEIENIPSKIDGETVAVLLLTPLALLLDLVIFFGYHWLWPDPLDIRRRRQKSIAKVAIMAS